MNLDLVTHDDIEKLQVMIDELNAKLDIIMTGISAPDVVYVSDVARVERLTVQGLKKQPWLMPNFGKSDYEGRCRWKYDTYRKWRDQPVSVRKRAWDNLACR